jgi:two-component system alkaline phosphatase synthesis response regulator PhoP
MKTMSKVLIVDDESDIIELLEYNLKKEGYEVKSASNGEQAIDEAKKFQPDLILMDIMMPKMDGIEACRRIREFPSLKNVFILFLTARSEEYSEVAAFEVGADDFINKPIKPRALMSRVAVLLKRNKIESDTEVLEIGSLKINKNSYEVYKGTDKIVLPKKEFELLHFLAAHPNKVFGREELLKNIWGTDVYVVARTVDVHIRKVREKVGEECITTIKGIGYKFNTESQ